MWVLFGHDHSQHLMISLLIAPVLVSQHVDGHASIFVLTVRGFWNVTHQAM